MYGAHAAICKSAYQWNHTLVHAFACMHIYACKHACMASIYTYKHTYINTSIQTNNTLFDGDERVWSENIIEHLMEYMPEYRCSSMCVCVCVWCIIMFGAKTEGGRKLWSNVSSSIGAPSFDAPSYVGPSVLVEKAGARKIWSNIWSKICWSIGVGAHARSYFTRVLRLQLWLIELLVKIFNKLKSSTSTYVYYIKSCIISSHREQHSYTHTYIHAYIHTHIHTYTCTYERMLIDI